MLKASRSFGRIRFWIPPCSGRAAILRKTSRRSGHSTTLLVLLAAFCILNGYLQPVNFLLNGVGAFRVQVICAIVMAVLNIALSIYFVHRYGLFGAILGTVIAQLLVQAAPLTLAARRVLRGLQQAPDDVVRHEA